MWDKDRHQKINRLNPLWVITYRQQVRSIAYHKVKLSTSPLTKLDHFKTAIKNSYVSFQSAFQDCWSCFDYFRSRKPWLQKVNKQCSPNLSLLCWFWYSRIVIFKKSNPPRKAKENRYQSVLIRSYSFTSLLKNPSLLS